MPVVVANPEKITKKRVKRKPKKIEDFQKIDFLNFADRRSMASIGVKISGEISGKSYGDNYDIKITDCDRHIILHGNLKTPDSRRNALKKFDTLIQVLTEGRNHIEQQLKANNLRYK